MVWLQLKTLIVIKVTSFATKYYKLTAQVEEVRQSPLGWMCEKIPEGEGTSKPSTVSTVRHVHAKVEGKIGMK